LQNVFLDDRGFPDQSDDYDLLLHNIDGGPVLRRLKHLAPDLNATVDPAFYSEFIPEVHEAQMRQEVESKAIPMEKWEPWEGEARPGMFWAEDLMAVRKELLDSGRNPKVVMKTLKDYSSLKYHCVKRVDGAFGLCVIKELPKHSDAI
jgi:hypothetical protein